MNIVRLFYIYIICLSSSLFGFSDDTIKTLQNNFYNEVLKIKSFKNIFPTYLHKQCSIGDNKCYLSLINILQTWESTQDNKLLNNKLLKLYKLHLINKTYWNNIIHKLTKYKTMLHRSQFLSVIDLSKQLYILVLWDNKISKFYFIGNDLISSGDKNREKEIKAGEDHFFNSPTGIFKVKSGWRSDGKKKYDKFTYPYGEKDRYVFYFGKQKGIRYNTFDKNREKITNKDKWKLITGHFEFAMHAHKSIYLFGKQKSHGCIRISNELNLFLDNNFVLHKRMIKNNKWIHPYIEAPKTPANINLAGQYLIIF